jgi:hypothetical protein
MALGRCENCHTKLRFGSRTCARCGTKKNRTKLLFVLVITAQFLIIVWYEFVHVKVGGGLDVIASSSLNIIPPPQATPPAGWLYYETRDDLVHDVTKHARVLSRGAATTGAKDTATNGVMELRASSVYGRSILLTLNRRPFDHVNDQCDVHAQLDTGEDVDMHAACYEDSVHATVQVLDTNGFSTRLVGHRNVAVDVRLSPKSNLSAMFDIGGLKW